MKKKELKNIFIDNSALRGVVDTPGEEQSGTPLVQKSHQLLEALTRSGYNLLQHKLIDCYLRRINTHQPQYREVVFEKAELESLLGGKRIKTDDIIAALDEFLKMPLRIVVDIETGEVVEISLFSRAEIGYYEGRLLIALRCSEEAIPYLFNLEENGYIKYPLMTSLAMPNKYVFMLYMYLLENHFRGHWQEDVTVLRSVMGCESTYPQFFLFNEKVLKTAHMRIEENSNICYTYREIKKTDRTLILFQMLNVPLNCQ